MKKILLPILVFAIASINLYAQDSFEGVIQFSIEYTIIDSSSGISEKMLKDIYGDRAEMYYLPNGNFKMKYLNSSGITIDADADYFFVGKDYLYNTYSLKNKIDSINITKESSKLLNLEKLNKQRILGKECNCYIYKAIDDYKEPANFTYCFTEDSPIINADSYTHYKHSYLGEFFKISERPYLLFSYEIEGFKVTFRATQITQMELGDEVFQID